MVPDPANASDGADPGSESEPTGSGPGSESASGSGTDAGVVAGHRSAWLFGVVAIALGDMALRFSEYLAGERDAQFNTAEVWWPLAREVLAGGAPYLAHWDNKPPLFQFVNVGVAALSGGNLTLYLLAFWLLVGVANAATAVLLWRWLAGRGFERAGLVAALVYVCFLTVGNGHQIDPRPFANCCLVYGFVTTDRYRSGAAVAAAGLLTQFALLALPVVLWYRIRRSGMAATRYALGFWMAGGAVLVASFGAVALRWGGEAALAGVRYSYLSAGRYAAIYTDAGQSLLGNPAVWAYEEWQTLRAQAFWLACAGVAVFAWYRRWEGYRTPLVPAATLAFVVLSLPRVIRHGGVYSLLPFAMLAPLSALGLCALLAERVAATERRR